MAKQFLDFILASSGLVIMISYHIWLLHRIIKHPTRTVIGVNAINRRFWVRAMMEDVSKNGVLAVQTLRNNIMASTLLASTAIMLSSLIAVLMTSGSGDRSLWLVFGDRSELFFSIKFFLILLCFLVAFLLNVQSIRYYSHASILINVPYKKISQNLHHQQLTAEYVAKTVNKGSYFWSLGLRAFYFSFPLFLWIFGPVPMFLSSFFLVFMLYFLDVAFELGVAVVDSNDDHQKDEELLVVFWQRSSLQEVHCSLQRYFLYLPIRAGFYLLYWAEKLVLQMQEAVVLSCEPNNVPFYSLISALAAPYS